MPYVPPHKRNTQNDWTTVTTSKKKTVNSEKPKKKEYSEEFPSLNKEMESLPRIIQQEPTKLSLSTLFKNSLNRRKKKKQVLIKKGWILMTWNGVIDSLTPEERKDEDDAHELRMYQIRLNHLTNEMEHRDNLRRENDHTYLWEWEKTRAEFDVFEPEDSDSEYYSETESDFYDDDTFIEEQYND